MSATLVADKTELPVLRSGLGLPRPDRFVGWRDWLTTVDHKKIGVMYGAAACFFFLVGGVEALMIRTQLIKPMNHFITAQLYNQLFTMHGTTMIFLGVMPLSAAFFNFVVPLQIGARDVAFPRLNAFSLWTFFAGAILLNGSWILQLFNTLGVLNPVDGRTDIAPGGGWFGYATLTEKPYTGIGTDVWILSLQILGVASLAAAFNFITTIINLRAPGMTMMRMPVFCWMTLVTSFLIIFAFPPITIALGELLFDRTFDTNFFNPNPHGGQPIFWQHLFWVFGHPEVYILVLPAMGIVSEVLPTFSRKPLFGYPIIVFSGAVIGLLGFAVWSHHMFATGLGKVATAAFSLLTMAIAVPTGVKIFNWIGTLWGGRIRYSVPMIFSLGFIWMFMLGGFTGIMHSAAPADAEQHDSYFIIAHFHYVLLGGVLLGLLSGIYYWVPKIFGKMMNQKLGYWVAGLVIVGFNVAFGPMHYLGLIGMTRRTYTYLGDKGWGFWNMICTFGAYMLGLGVFLCFMDLVITVLSKKRQCSSDPWNARTLEWSLPSPVPAYNFARLPIVSCRDAWWMHKHNGIPIEYDQADLSHGVHMPSQSWMPLGAGFGMYLFGMGVVLMSAGIPHFGYVAIAGLCTTVFFIYLWALEGPGGYHLKVPDEPAPVSPAPTGGRVPVPAHH
ncbi:MAG TPA: cbb3-type cytochrome c oxidase subunit I [Opitutales bacterium]|nr:cbb3-type cytochrome c oxidase subunit I [Opitutales bacterium]